MRDGARGHIVLLRVSICSAQSIVKEAIARRADRAPGPVGTDSDGGTDPGAVPPAQAGYGGGATRHDTNGTGVAGRYRPVNVDVRDDGTADTSADANGEIHPTEEQP